AGETRLRGDVLEGTVPAVAEQAGSAATAGRLGRGGPALHHVDVEPAVAVVVEEGDAARPGFGGLPPGGWAVCANEPQPPAPSIVDEARWGPQPFRDRQRPTGNRVVPEVGAQFSECSGGVGAERLGTIEPREDRSSLLATGLVKPRQGRPPSRLEP